MVNINEIQLKINDSFVFRRFEKIDWKQIASLNMEQLKVGADWNIIEKNLCNILCCHLESEFKQCDLDPNVCKLFQLAQVSIEYLLQIRQQILTELQNCQEKMQATQLSLSEAIKSKEQAEKKLKELKKESKKTTNQQNFYRCPACPKTFFTGEFLHGHWQRRHPEYVTVTSLTPAAARASPVRPSTPVVEMISCIPPVSVSSPIKPIETPAVPSQHSEISELKARLQLAETHLQNEQQLLQSVIEKMEKSSVNLQDVLVQEVQKICATLRQEKMEPPVVAAQAPCSPQKCVQSSSVQTTPPMCHPSDTPPPPSPLRRNSVTDSGHVVTAPTPNVRSVHKQKSTNMSHISISPPKENESSSHSSPASSISESSSQNEPTRTEVATAEKTDVACQMKRPFLVDRFRKTIENALEKRMQLLGMDTKRRTMSTSTLRHVSEKLKSSRQQSADYLHMRRQFEWQLKERLKESAIRGATIPSKSHKKAKGEHSKPLLSRASNYRHKRAEMEREHALMTTPLRAPVPTPRSRNQITEPSTRLSFMARDGEAHSALASTNAKQPTAHLERQMNEQVLNEPVVDAKDGLPKATLEEAEKAETEEDSFSFSSLDVMLTQLKKTNGFISETPPTATKSVQWRIPVETVQDPIDDSWDTP